MKRTRDPDADLAPEPDPPTPSSATTVHDKPPSAEPDPPPWAHVDPVTVDPVVPLPGEKRHPVYTWLEQHDVRLGRLEWGGIGLIAGGCLGFLVLAGALAGLIAGLAW